MFWLVLELLSKYLLEIGFIGVYVVVILIFIGLCFEWLRYKKKEKYVFDFDD